jgi:hypothetical protein
MRKFVIILLCIPFIILFNSCEKGDTKEIAFSTIIIETDKYDYNTNEKVLVSITNNLNVDAIYNKCDNHDLRASYLLIDESNSWLQEELGDRCTTMGPAGFWGTILPSETKKDSTYFENAGLYKLKYTFIINSDTAYYYSNDFQVSE